jgi:hypothetical protein
MQKIERGQGKTPLCLKKGGKCITTDMGKGVEIKVWEEK